MPFGNTLSLRAWPCPGPPHPPAPPGALAGLGPGIACQAPAAPYWCVGCPVLWAAPVQGRDGALGRGLQPLPHRWAPFGKEQGSRQSHAGPPRHRDGGTDPSSPVRCPLPAPLRPGWGTRALCSPRSPGDARQCLTGARGASSSGAPRRPALPLCARRSPARRRWRCRLPELCSTELVPGRTDGAVPWPGAAPRRGRGRLCPLPPRHWRRDSRAGTLLLEKFILPLYGEILFVVNSSVMNLEFL